MRSKQHKGVVRVKSQGSRGPVARCHVLPIALVMASGPQRIAAVVMGRVGNGRAVFAPLVELGNRSHSKGVKWSSWRLHHSTE